MRIITWVLWHALPSCQYLSFRMCGCVALHHVWTMPSSARRYAGNGVDLGGNLFGLVKFYSGARGKGVKPVPGGCLDHRSPDDTYRLLLAPGVASVTSGCANC